MLDPAEAAGLVGVLAAAAVFSSGIAYWLIKSGLARSQVRASTISALAASGILTLVPIVVVAAELNFTGEFWIVLVTIMVGAIFMAAVAGFPAALYVVRRTSKSTSESDPADGATE